MTFFIATAMKTPNLTLLSNFALEHTIKNFNEKQLGLKLNGTHQLLVCAVDVSLFGHNVNTKENKTCLWWRIRCSD
jgi:hypothetical protein